jgi:hypothetical protein
MTLKCLLQQLKIGRLSAPGTDYSLHIGVATALAGQHGYHAPFELTVKLPEHTYLVKKLWRPSMLLMGVLAFPAGAASRSITIDGLSIR